MKPLSPRGERGGFRGGRRGRGRGRGRGTAGSGRFGRGGSPDMTVGETKVVCMISV